MIPIVLVIAAVVLLNQPEHEMTFEFYSDSKLDYDMSDYDHYDYVVENVTELFYNDPEHTKIDAFHQDVINNDPAVLNRVQYGIGNMRRIDNVYFDGDNLFLNKYQVSSRNMVSGCDNYTCSNQIEVEVTDDAVLYWAIDCQRSLPRQELERLILYEQQLN